MLESEFQRLKADNRIWFGASGASRPRIKTYIDETKGISSWMCGQIVRLDITKKQKKEINEILGGETTFDYPKPVRPHQ